MKTFISGRRKSKASNHRKRIKRAAKRGRRIADWSGSMIDLYLSPMPD